MASSTVKHIGSAIPKDLLAKMSKEFRSNARNIQAMNAITKNEITNTIVNRDLPLDTYHVYSHRLEQDAKATNQKSSGRCWLFAALNVLRLDLMKRYKLDEFEFSQTYLMWFDKLEKSNWFLDNILNTLDEDLEGRLVQFLLHNPVQDGGQWDMAVSLIEKYGLVPKAIFPESAHSGSTAHLNWMITVKLREYAARLRAGHKAGKSHDDLLKLKEEMLAEIYNILAITLGEPPVSFTWNIRDKDKKFSSFKDLTPLTFYREHVKGDLQSMVSLVHDPRHEYYKLYTVQYLGNVAGGNPVLYINLPIEDLKKYAMESIKDNKAVWYGCDVGKFSNRMSGIMDLDLYDYKNSYGVAFGLDKADRLRYGESLMSHAMTLTGVHIEDDKPVRWRVENSWGEDRGEKGFFSMTDNWFTEYVYQVVVDKKMLPESVLDVLKQSPIAFPPWDPLGALA